MTAVFHPWLSAMVRKEAGRWITIGGSKGEGGKRHGGSPVFIKDGKIVKGHPSLTGKKIGDLKGEAEHGTHRQQLNQSRDHAKASLRKQARKEGHDPDSVESLAHEIKAHHDAFAAERKDVLREAREFSKGNKFADLQRRGKEGYAAAHEDAAYIRGFDQTAEHVRNAFPHHFHPETGEHGSHADQLHAMLTEGHPEPMDLGHAFKTAMEHIGEPKPKDKKPKAEDRGYPADWDDEIPKMMHHPWLVKSLPHDVSGEKRDESGQWTTGGSASKTSTALAKKKEPHEIPLRAHIKEQRRTAGHDDEAAKRELTEAAQELATIAPKIANLDRLLNPEHIHDSRSPADLEKIANDSRRPPSVRAAVKRYLKARDPVHYMLNHKHSTAHAQAVEDALKNGKHVPPEVLADYPQLADQYHIPGVTRIADPSDDEHKDPATFWRDEHGPRRVREVIAFHPWLTKGIPYDESKHKRDHGKFSSTAGARGQAKPSVDRTNPDLDAAFAEPPARKPAAAGPLRPANPDLDAFMAMGNEPAKPARREPPPVPQRQQPSPQHVAAAKQVMDKASRISDPGVMIGYLRQQLGKAQPGVQQAFAASAGLTANDTPEQVVAKLQKAGGEVKPLDKGEQTSKRPMPKMSGDTQQLVANIAGNFNLKSINPGDLAGEIRHRLAKYPQSVRAEFAKVSGIKTGDDPKTIASKFMSAFGGSQDWSSDPEVGGQSKPLPVARFAPSRHDNPREDRTARGTPEPARDRSLVKLPHGTQVRGGAIRLPKRKVKAWHPWLTGEGR